MTDKLAVVLLDALGPVSMRQYDGFDTIRQKYKENGEVLGISTLPHTAQSNPMIWGGVDNPDKFWVESEEWIDPAMHFELRGHAHEGAEEKRNYTRQDFNDSFIWDDLDATEYNACALQVPICLPPYSFNTSNVLEDAWFPDTQERMHAHIREKTKKIIEHVTEYDFIATSIQMPDKWLHGIAEGKCSQEFVNQEAKMLDMCVENMIESFEAVDMDWIFAGDHGSPHPGSMPVREAREVLPRHRKEAVIFGSTDTLPTYTDEFYPFMLDYFGIEETEYVPEQTVEVEQDVTEEVENRLENLGYR